MNYRRYFKENLINSLTKQVSACKHPDEQNAYYTMDILYKVEEEAFFVLFNAEHGFTNSDADFCLWDIQERGTLEEVVNKILKQFVEKFGMPEEYGIPLGGYYCRPITWSPPPLETLIVHDVQLLSPKKQEMLEDSFDGRSVKIELKVMTERTELWISFPPRDKQAILNILSRFVKH